jgi:hypothetical protein
MDLIGFEEGDDRNGSLVRHLGCCWLVFVLEEPREESLSPENRRGNEMKVEFMGLNFLIE